MRIESFKLTRLETFLIAITIAGIWLAGSKIAIVIITTILLLICNLRGFYLWVILDM